MQINEEEFGEFQSANQNKTKDELNNELNNDSDNINEDELFIFGDEHENTDHNYYDIKLINFKKFIKPYNGNRIIDINRVNDFVTKYISKPFFIPPLIVYYINDLKEKIQDYVLLDGQHRYEALKILHTKDIKPKFTYIMLSGTLQQAKEEFKNINSNVKFDDIYSYEKPADLITKITTHFSNAVSKSDNPQSHKFNPIHLKKELINKKFFDKVKGTVESIFNEILVLNEKIFNEYSALQLKVKDKKVFDKIKGQTGNKMFLLMDSNWLIKLIAKLEKLDF